MIINEKRLFFFSFSQYQHFKGFFFGALASAFGNTAIIKMLESLFHEFTPVITTPFPKSFFND